MVLLGIAVSFSDTLRWKESILEHGKRFPVLLTMSIPIGWGVADATA
jgi:hypothetical protein